MSAVMSMQRGAKRAGSVTCRKSCMSLVESNRRWSCPSVGPAEWVKFQQDISCSWHRILIGTEEALQVCK